MTWPHKRVDKSLNDLIGPMAMCSSSGPIKLSDMIRLVKRSDLIQPSELMESSPSKLTELNNSNRLRGMVG